MSCSAGCVHSAVRATPGRCVCLRGSIMPYTYACVCISASGGTPVIAIGCTTIFTTSRITIRGTGASTVRSNTAVRTPDYAHTSAV